MTATLEHEQVNGTGNGHARRPTVVELIAKCMAEVQAVGKGDRNNEQGYNFRGIDAVVNAVGPVFRKHGVVPAPMLESTSYRDVQTSRGKPSRECTVQVRYRFHGPAGDSLDVIVPGESMDFGDKGTAKAMSVAYRIALLQLLAIPTHEPEPDAQSYERDNEPPRPSASREQTMAKGRQTIAAATDLAHLPPIAARADQLFADGVILADDHAELRAAITQREEELRPASQDEAAA